MKKILVVLLSCISFLTHALEYQPYHDEIVKFFVIGMKLQEHTCANCQCIKKQLSQSTDTQVKASSTTEQIPLAQFAETAVAALSTTDKLNLILNLTEDEKALALKGMLKNLLDAKNKPGFEKIVEMVEHTVKHGHPDSELYKIFKKVAPDLEKIAQSNALMIAPRLLRLKGKIDENLRHKISANLDVKLTQVVSLAKNIILRPRL